MNRILAMLVVATLAGGCIVPKKKLDALQAEYDGAKTTLEDRIAVLEADLEASTTAGSECEASLTAEEARYVLLETRAAEEDAECAAQIEELLAEKAALVKDRSKLEASVTEMEEALEELAARKEAAEDRISEYKDLLSRFETLIDAGRLRVKIVDGRMVVEMATDILFASGKAALSDEGTEALKEVAAVLADIGERSFQIEGHTDNVPISTERFPSNWELASARAITVVHTLEEGGVAAERLSAASYADLRPVGENDTAEGKASNRRIEIVVVPDLSQLPGFEELKDLSESD